MREIKFRYRIATYPTYEIVEANKVIVTRIYTIDEIEKGTRLRISDRILSRDQYTGLKDKNGVEIYEGDVCYCTRLVDDHDIIELGEGYIGFLDSAFVFFGKEDNYILHLITPNQIEVIGNIYENKELLCDQ